MNFMGCYFHQIKGTAMGTPMAVNFANPFMAKFEQELLFQYEKESGRKPSSWLRFIDDIFFIWTGDKRSLNDFMSFCNHFYEQHGYSSKIKFTFNTSTKSVNFLDTTVTLNPDGTLSTNLYAKPTAAHNYLHHLSYHVPYVIKSIPISQFTRIRRNCSTIGDY